MPALLLLGSECDQGGTEHGKPVLVDTNWGARARVLLLEKQGFDRGAAASSVFSGPAHHAPSTVEESALPFAMLFESNLCIEVPQRFSRDVPFEPLACVVLEFELGSAQRQIHPFPNHSEAIILMIESFEPGGSDGGT
jgi:hypothetical protein